MTNKEILLKFEEIKEQLTIAIMFVDRHSIGYKYLQKSLSDLEKTTVALKEKIKSDMIAYNSEKLLINLKIALSEEVNDEDIDLEDDTEDEEPEEELDLEELLKAKGKTVSFEDFLKSVLK